MIRRREFTGLAAVGLAACTQAHGEYFGDTTPPPSAKLVHSLLAEPATLDPAKSGEDIESYVVPVLFEGLTAYHPLRPEPMAALATHYETSHMQDRFVFYLRGHPAPRGIRLTGSEDLPPEFLSGRQPAPDAKPAYWSDGRRITAHDFVFSWRRLVIPETAAPMAYQLYRVKNEEEISTGKRSSKDLGVRAIDDFTFEVVFRSPTPFFVHLIAQFPFSAVPRQAIEAAQRRGNESAWTDPENIVVSGPFTLKEWRRYEVLTAARNPRYYDANIVRIEELSFPIVVDSSTIVGLYRYGALAAMPGPSFPPLFTPVLAHKKDFHNDPAFATVFPVMNVLRPPFDNVLLRYALNMATERKAFTHFLDAGHMTARTLIPPVAGYRAPASVPVTIDGNTYDVLSFNVEAARALLAKAGFRPGALEVTYYYPILPETRQMGEILQEQWRRHLGIRVKLAPLEFTAHWAMIRDGNYSGVAGYAFFRPDLDPNPFLEQFLTAGPGNPAGWTDPSYTGMLAAANRSLDSNARMAGLAECEHRLLKAMPFIPLYHGVWAYLQKPYVKGLRGNQLEDMRAFKYAWIDTKWRPS